MVPIFSLIVIACLSFGESNKSSHGLEESRTWNLEEGGRVVARLFLKDLEQGAMQIQPGGLSLELKSPERVGKEVFAGLKQVLKGNGFFLSDSPSFRGKGKPLLELTVSRQRREWLLSLWNKREPHGPWLCRVQEKEWVGSPNLPKGCFRVVSAWTDSSSQALTIARKRAEGVLVKRLRARLSWRPWRESILFRAINGRDWEQDFFLEKKRLSASCLWRAHLLWHGTTKRVESTLFLAAKEDRKWSIRIGLALASAVILLLTASRLDWASKGFFTLPIRMGAFLIWLGVCAVVGLMV